MEKKEAVMYTKSGDRGLTSLLPGSQVSKADERVGAIGGVEEIISSLGMVKVATACPVFRGKIERIQKTLRTMCAGLADPRSGKYVFSAEEIEFLESDMEMMGQKLSPEAMKNALPGGCEQSARLDVAFTVARRAERDLIAMDRRYSVPAVFKMYENRLCAYLAVAARYADYLNETEQETKEAAATQACPLNPPSVPPVTGQSLPGGTMSPPASSVESLVARVVSDLGGRVITLEKATKLIAAVEAKAASEGRKTVVAVVNAEGNPIAVHVMDGAFLVSYEVAVRKAYTSAAVKMSTRELSLMVQPGQTFYGLQNMEKIVTFGGGVPLKVGDTIVGGLGVSGGTGDEDDALAQFGASVFSTL